MLQLLVNSICKYRGARTGVVWESIQFSIKVIIPGQLPRSSDHVYFSPAPSIILSCSLDSSHTAVSNRLLPITREKTAELASTCWAAGSGHRLLSPEEVLSFDGLLEVVLRLVVSAGTECHSLVVDILI